MDGEAKSDSIIILISNPYASHDTFRMLIGLSNSVRDLKRKITQGELTCTLSIH